jgi:hypothetical protein
MLETTQTQRPLAPGDMFSPVPLAVKTVRPHVSIRRATAEEQASAQVWRSIVAPDGAHPEVAEYHDGSMTHAPEVVAAYRDIAPTLPDDFLLIYLHRGAQAQSVNPLLPSLLHLTGHQGPSHALRRATSEGALSADVVRFVRAMTPSGSAALIVDDRQLRLATPGRITPAEVHFHQFLKPGLAQSSLVGAYQ